MRRKRRNVGTLAGTYRVIGQGRFYMVPSINGSETIYCNLEKVKLVFYPTFSPKYLEYFNFSRIHTKRCNLETIPEYNPVF